MAPPGVEPGQRERGRERGAVPLPAVMPHAGAIVLLDYGVKVGDSDTAGTTIPYGHAPEVVPELLGQAHGVLALGIDTTDTGFRVGVFRERREAVKESGHWVPSQLRLRLTLTPDHWARSVPRWDVALTRCPVRP